MHSRAWHLNVCMVVTSAHTMHVSTTQTHTYTHTCAVWQNQPRPTSDVSFDSVWHAVMVPSYKEPIDKVCVCVCVCDVVMVPSYSDIV